MFKALALLGSVTLIVVGLGQSSVRAATAIAIDDRDVVYSASRTSLTQAKVDVLRYCNANSNVGCRVIGTNSFTGYGAVAQSATQGGIAMGHSSQERANQVALESCRSNMLENETCRLILQYVD
jgi:hypothetical protein